jgi:hypothetical protein
LERFAPPVAVVFVLLGVFLLKKLTETKNTMSATYNEHPLQLRDHSKDPLDRSTIIQGSFASKDDINLSRILLVNDRIKDHLCQGSLGQGSSWPMIVSRILLAKDHMRIQNIIFFLRILKKETDTLDRRIIPIRIL